MDTLKNDEIRQAVRQQYGRVAEGDGARGGCDPACCGTLTSSAETLSQGLGYTADDVGTVPPGANMGLGCGNPQAIAVLKTGEIVLDLGSGGGFDCFLAARQVGDTGQVIGVDMTPEMISRPGLMRRKAATATSNSTLAKSRICQWQMGWWMSLSRTVSSTCHPISPACSLMRIAS